jgi:hypothetical protein
MICTHTFMLHVIYRPGININRFRQSNGIECTCTDMASCHMPAAFYDIETFDKTRGIFDQQAIKPREYLSEWFTGCWPAETLLMSTLNNLYNRTALNAIIRSIDSSMNHTSNMTWMTLNVSSYSIYTHTSTFTFLTKNLFVESLTKQLNYTSYFEQCRLESCFVDVNERASFLYMFTSLLGLYGGLSVALVFITPILVTYLMKLMHCRTHSLVNELNNTGKHRT